MIPSNYIIISIHIKNYMYVSLLNFLIKKLVPKKVVTSVKDGGLEQFIENLKPLKPGNKKYTTYVNTINYQIYRYAHCTEFCEEKLIFSNRGHIHCIPLYGKMHKMYIFLYITSNMFRKNCNL